MRNSMTMQMPSMRQVRGFSRFPNIVFLGGRAGSCPSMNAQYKEYAYASNSSQQTDFYL
jgi:hypothetical protein